MHILKSGLLVVIAFSVVLGGCDPSISVEGRLVDESGSLLTKRCRISYEDSSGRMFAPRETGVRGEFEFVAISTATSLRIRVDCGADYAVWERQVTSERGAFELGDVVMTDAPPPTLKNSELEIYGAIINYFSNVRGFAETVAVEDTFKRLDSRNLVNLPADFASDEEVVAGLDRTLGRLPEEVARFTRQGYASVRSDWAYAYEPSRQPGVVTSGWSRIRETLPDVDVVLGISPAGISAAGDIAVAYVGVHCGEFCGGGGFVILTRRRDNWEVVEFRRTMVF